MWTLHEGDCLEVMSTLPEASVDMILCDLPYGTTSCKWDVIIPFEPLWEQYERVIKDNGAIALTAIQPFTSMLIMSNLRLFKYSLVWKKSRKCHFAQAPYRFLTEHEDICVFSKGGCSKNAKVNMKYNPQGIKSCLMVCSGKGYSEHRPVKNKQKDYIQTVTGYPTSVIEFQSDNALLHPTQKPVALFEYLIRTYTNIGDLVLDNCAGSGTTGMAAEQCGRNSILIEKEPKYCNIIRERMSQLQYPLMELL